MFTGFKCNRCNRVLKTKYKLKKHYLLHLDEDPSQCNICHKILKNKYNLNKHYWLHSGEKPFQCDICHTKFALKQYLQNHYRKHTNEKPFRCEICDSSFRQKSNLALHQLVHTGDRPYSCDMCNRAFSQKNNLKNHMALHHGKDSKPYQCKMCNKSFALKSYLQKHLSHSLAHIGVGSHVCKICKKVYTEAGTLTKHLRTHSKDKPYSCTECDKQFVWKEAYERHKVIHNVDVTMFHCGQCEKSFRLKTYLLDHLNRAHIKDRKRHACPICKKTYASKESANKHMKTMHLEPPNDELKCDECGNIYKSLLKLSCHMKIHLRPFQCQVCNEGFSSKNNLNTHSKIHLEYYDQYQCGICERFMSSAGNLTRHILVTHGKKRMKKEVKEEITDIKEDPDISNAKLTQDVTQNTMENVLKEHAEIKQEN